MTKSENEIWRLLEDLKAQNAADQYAELFPQKIKPSLDRSEIGTLSPEVTHPLTPMLLERFKYADQWTNAVAGFVWLGLDEIIKARSRVATMKQIARRRKNWPSSFSKANDADVTLFGIDREEQNETYLLWGNRREPRVFHYYGHEEHAFADFRQFLLWLLGRAKD